MSLAHAASALAASIPAGPLEVPDLDTEPGASIESMPPSAINAVVVSSSASIVIVTRVMAIAHADRPLEVEISSTGPCPGARAAAAVARTISEHALLTVSTTRRGIYQAALSAQPMVGGWIVRALILPATWADETFITVSSIALAGRPMPCDFLPAKLFIGYNHAPAPPGAVFNAALTGDVVALQAALDAGGSTEEADEVSVQQDDGA